MRTILAIVALTLAACTDQPAPPRLAQIEQECGYSRKQFVEAWPCISVGYAYPGEDIRAAYIAKGNYAAEQVREGRMSDAEARMIMAEAYQQALSAHYSRQATASAGATADAVIIGGLLNRRPYTPAPTFQMRQPVTCYPAGYNITCY